MSFTRSKLEAIFKLTYSLVRSIPRPFFKGKDFVTYIEYLKNQFQIENTETDKGSKKLSNKEKNILIQGVLWWFDDQISKFEREIAKKSMLVKF